MLHLCIRGSLCFWCSYKVWKHLKSLFCPHCSDVPCPVWCVEGRDGVWGGSSSLLCLHCPVWWSWIIFFPWGVVLQVGWGFLLLLLCSSPAPCKADFWGTYCLVTLRMFYYAMQRFQPKKFLSLSLSPPLSVQLFFCLPCARKGCLQEGMVFIPVQHGALETICWLGEADTFVLQGCKWVVVATLFSKGLIKLPLNISRTWSN